jgi:hypothetical protein
MLFIHFSWEKEVDEKLLKIELTLPSYSFLERTSGAMYAGVPTVDFGFECSKAD